MCGKLTLKPKENNKESSLANTLAHPRCSSGSKAA